MHTIPRNPALQATAARLLTAIQARQTAPAGPPEGRHQTPGAALQALKTSEQHQAQAVRVRVPQQQHQQPAAIVEGHQLADGPRRLFDLLHQLALEVAAARGYLVGTSQAVMHQAQELLAAALGVHRVTVWRWADELERAGLIQRRQHYTSTSAGRGKGQVTRADGTLFAVSLKAGHRARLRFDDLKARHRDLDAARKAGNTAFSVVQQSLTLTEVSWFQVLRRWAVNPDSDHITPLKHDCCIAPPDVPRTVPAVVLALGMLREVHASKRAALIGELGSALSHALDDTRSRRYFCKVLWQAWRDECAGRGGLQVLGAALSRLTVDMAEWPGLKNPAALLAARLR